MSTLTKIIFQPLPRSPQATTVTVRSLIQRVADGQVRVPAFQRPLRWRAKDVVLLLDSIWRGYPIGNLLCWVRPAAAEQISIGGALLEVPATDSAWWVVDGQQRIIALAASLLELEREPEKTWIARFDPEQDMFLEGPVPPDRRGRDVPASALGDLRRLGKWFRSECLLDDEFFFEKIEKTQQKILDYSIPLYIVDTDDTQALQAIFARVNSTGSRMKAEEVFQALVGSSDEERGLTLNLARLQKSININNFGHIEKSEITKSIMVMSGFSPTRKIEDLKDRLDQFVHPLEAEEALKKSILFLKEKCGIPRADLIPYPGHYVILSKWFYLYPDSNENTLKELARWFWRSVISAIYNRSSAANMNRKIKDIQPNDEQGSLDRLLKSTIRPRNMEWGLEKFNSKSTKSRIEILFLLSQKPMDNEGVISAEDIADRKNITTQLLPDTMLLPHKTETSAWKTIANRVIIRSHDSKSLNENNKKIETDEMLESHLINEDALNHYNNGEYIFFIEKRGREIKGKIERFLSEKAQWDHPRTKPIQTYFDLDEDDDA